MLSIKVRPPIPRLFDEWDGEAGHLRSRMMCHNCSHSLVQNGNLLFFDEERDRWIIECPSCGRTNVFPTARQEALDV